MIARNSSSVVGISFVICANGLSEKITYAGTERSLAIVNLSVLSSASSCGLFWDSIAVEDALWLCAVDAVLATIFAVKPVLAGQPLI